MVSSAACPSVSRSSQEMLRLAGSLGLAFLDGAAFSFGPKISAHPDLYSGVVTLEKWLIGRLLPDDFFGLAVSVVALLSAVSALGASVVEAAGAVSADLVGVVSLEGFLAVSFAMLQVSGNWSMMEAKVFSELWAIFSSVCLSQRTGGALNEQA